MVAYLHSFVDAGFAELRWRSRFIAERILLFFGDDMTARRHSEYDAHTEAHKVREVL
jgi:hypothetical protein